MAPQSSEGNPQVKIRLDPEIQRRMRTRAAFLRMTIAEYISGLIESDTEELFHRIDSPLKNGGR